MNSNKTYKIIELFLLFVIVPLLLALNLSTKIKVSSVIVALVYVCFISYKNKKTFNFRVGYNKPSKKYILRLFSISILLIVGGLFIINFINPQLLFKVPKEKPLLWLTILFVYAFLSVIPQELVYRGFFYNRYSLLFNNKNQLAILNVICFSWCHLFLHNLWVMLITAVGGILFLYTYREEKSIFWTVVEHSVYGNLVFTLGLGEMLAFPS